MGHTPLLEEHFFFCFFDFFKPFCTKQRKTEVKVTPNIKRIHSNSFTKRSPPFLHLSFITINNPKAEIFPTIFFRILFKKFVMFLKKNLSTSSHFLVIES